MKPRTNRNMQSCEGTILIAVLIYSAFLLLLSLNIWYYANHGLKLHVSALHSAKARALALAEALYQPVPIAALTTQQLQCQESQVTVGKNTAVRTICSIYDQVSPALPMPALIDGRSPPALKSFPRFDYVRIFSIFSQCTAKVLGAHSKTASGFILTPDAVCSSLMCSTIPTRITTPFAVQANVYTGSSIQLNSNLYATGYIDLAGGVHVAHDAMIVAGGDLHIKLLTGKGRLAILSATGTAAIDEIRGEIALRAIAWAGVYVPPGAVFSDDAPLPPLLPVHMLGLMENL